MRGRNIWDTIVGQAPRTWYQSYLERIGDIKTQADLKEFEKDMGIAQKNGLITPVQKARLIRMAREQV